MEISKHMKRNVVSIPETSTIREAAAVLVKHHIGLLPIVGQNKKLIGVVGLRDLLALELPDFINFIADVDYVHDFGAVDSDSWCCCRRSSGNRSTALSCRCTARSCGTAGMRLRCACR